MTWNLRTTKTLTLLALFGLMAACGDDTPQDVTPEPADDDFLPPLVDISTIKPTDDGYDKADVPDYAAKFDVRPPKQFDLLSVQSPVRNQQSRGVCSIFAALGLMESLYIIEGTIKDPDFSEQHLQWVTKAQVKAFLNTSGSSADVNLRGIANFGVVEERVWPYEGRPWTAANDPECGKDEKERPWICHTNGNPSDEVLAAPTFKLPAGRWISSSPTSLKAYLFKEKKPVVIGMDFFYQSWSHGGSKLGINQELRRKSIILSPSKEDVEDSLQRRAGHAVLIVGYDDDMVAPRIDKDGKPLLNENGEPVFEKGFFLIKNSWGDAGVWGSENSKAKGYGWIGYKYVQEYGRSMTAGLPKVEPPKPKVELCGDGIDNTGNGLADCDDPACSSEAMCRPGNVSETRAFEEKRTVNIPDNNTTGITRVIESDLEGNISKLILTLDIEHSWVGDLNVILESPTGDIVIIQEADGKSGENLKKTVEVNQVVGKKAQGAWKLHVSDESRYDVGKLKSWSLTITN